MRSDLGRLEENIGFLASRFSYLAAKRADAALAPFGLSTKSYALLELTAVGEGTSQRELGRLLCLDPSRVLRLVDMLAERDLVERIRGTADRRVTQIRATSEGRRIAGAAAEAVTAAASDMFSEVPAADRGELRRMLRVIGFAG